MDPKRKSRKVITEKDKPSNIKTATINEGPTHTVHLCDDYLTTTDDKGTVTCLLARPTEVSIKEWRKIALVYRFSQRSWRAEIMSDIYMAAASHQSRQRMSKIGVWE